MNALGETERLAGDVVSAERDYREALRISTANGHEEGIAICTGNLARMALDQKDWPVAENLARTALPLSEKVGRKELIAQDCAVLARALARQGHKVEAVPHARRAVAIYTELRSPEFDEARALLVECEAQTPCPS